MPSYINPPNYIHIVFDDGKAATIYSSQEQYKAVLYAISLNRWDTVYELAFPTNKFIQKLNKNKELSHLVEFSDGIILYDGTPMHGTLVDRMISMLERDMNPTPMALFLENIMKNTSFRAVNELYQFLEKSKLPITEDGHFLAYKRVTSDLKDMYSRKFDNSPGMVVQMTRNAVNEDKNRTCSTGLHFCAYSYLTHYGNTANSKIILVKINPRDVVAIPSDYDDAKGRCCRYEVMCEVDKDEKTHLPIESHKIEDKHIVVVTPGAVQQIKLDARFDNLILVMATHESIEAAEKATGVKAAYIKRVCNGDRKSSGGFGWKWVPVSQPQPIDKDDAYDEEEYDIDYQDGWGY